VNDLGSKPRMFEPEQEGMKAQAAKRVYLASVGSIPDDRMPEFRHVNANLVFPARLERHFQNGELRETPQNAVMSDGLLAFCSILNRVHALHPILGEPAANGAPALFYLAFDNRPVFALDLVPAEQGLQFRLDWFRFGEHQHPACKFVEAMHDEQLQLWRTFFEILAQVGVNGALSLVRRRHRQKPYRFFDKHKVVVLENYLEAAHDQSRFPLVSHLNSSSRTDALGSDLCGLTIHLNAPVFEHSPQGSIGRTRDQDSNCLKKGTLSRKYEFHLAPIADEHPGGIREADSDFIGRNEGLDATQSEGAVLDPIAFSEISRHAIGLVRFV